ncbi:MAG: DUF5989 family protein [Planctomycetia bacterium]|jgi:hypothetical protein
MTQNDNQRSKEAEAFAKAAQGGRQSFFGEYLHFLKSTKKWWMAPLIFLLLLFALLLVLGSTGAAPFIYTLF